MSGVIAGLGLSVFGTGSSIVQGIQAKKLQRDADRAAQESLDQAKEKLSVNRMEGLQIPLEAYDTAMRETTAQSGQAVDALQQGDPRNLTAGLGKVFQAGAEDTEAIREKKAQDIYARDLAVAKAAQDIDQNLADISLAEVSGAQRASAQYGEEAASAFTGAIEGLGGMATSLASMGGLYSGKPEATSMNSGVESMGINKNAPSGYNKTNAAANIINPSDNSLLAGLKRYNY